MSTIGLGNALVDILLQLHDDDSLAAVNIAKGAMDMINEQQMKDIQERFSQLKTKLTPGGSVCNAMRAYAMLGGQAGFYGKVGTDNMGDYYESALVKAGVTPYFSRAEGPTGCCTVLISPDGERTMGTFLGPAPTISPEEIREEILNLYDYIYVEGYMVVNDELIRTAMAKAKKLGLKVALDLSNFNIVNSFRETFNTVIREYVDILIANETEIVSFTGAPVVDALSYMSKKVGMLAVTLGKKGSIIVKGSERIHIDAYGPPAPLDTTGAGDHFSAGFLYGLSRGANLRQAGRLGSLLAGHVINYIGPQIPDQEWEIVREQAGEIIPHSHNSSR
ncbi:MAG: adenosine kinase [Tannerellaceae bacterium]|jgi:sugar/nucleoside kinase (ribokinase family)|nr:adenosine kinase [Tannerellaceae bacterium]